LRSYRATYSFPLVHSDHDVREWIASHVVGELETWLAVSGPGAAAVGYIAIDGAEVRLLDVVPGRTGEGIGGRLLAHAMDLRPTGLELWTFQVNHGARRFYERHGFEVIELTDGAGNEERHPDVHYAWRP
jgi:GNAT superfamily N-acetyltransferase